MSFRQTTCPSCHRDVQIPTDVISPACPYCGHVFAGGGSPVATVATLLGLARTAQAAGNNEEALSYFNRVLEADPTNSDAWIGKGKAAAWQSSIKDMRLPEMRIAFGHGIANAPAEHRDAVVKQAILDANQLIVTLYGMARKHMMEYVSLPKIWPEYIQQVAKLIDNLVAVNKWLPSDPLTPKNIVVLCKDSMEGVSYRDKFNRNMPKSWTITPAYEATLREIMKSAVDQLQTIDPSYQPPKIAKKKAEACFVVTATMGDSEHPTVVMMRDFRDNWLEQRNWGRGFNKWYYRYGPIAAEFISDSLLRRKVVYYLIVRPAAWIASKLM